MNEVIAALQRVGRRLHDSDIDKDEWNRLYDAIAMIEESEELHGSRLDLIGNR